MGLLKNQLSNNEIVQDRSSKVEVAWFELSNCCHSVDLNTPTNQSRPIQKIAIKINARSGSTEPNSIALVFGLGKRVLYLLELSTAASGMLTAAVIRR